MGDYWSDAETMVQTGRIKVPYTWQAGETASWYFAQLRDEKKICGKKCSKCAKVLIPPRSPFIGKTIRQIGLRRRFYVEPVLMIRNGVEISGDFSDKPLAVGDGLILHGRWEHIARFGDRRRLVLVTPVEDSVQHRSSPVMAGICFGGAMILAFAGAPIAFVTV